VHLVLQVGVSLVVKQQAHDVEVAIHGGHEETGEPSLHRGNGRGVRGWDGVGWGRVGREEVMKKGWLRPQVYFMLAPRPTFGRKEGHNQATRRVLMRVVTGRGGTRNYANDLIFEAAGANLDDGTWHLARRLNVCIALEQQLHHVQAAAFGRKHQGCISFLSGMDGEGAGPGIGCCYYYYYEISWIEPHG
jgi:hypothetical protein